MSFADLVATGGGGLAGDPIGSLTMRVRADLAQGKMSDTGNPLDLAIGGDGFFQLRDGNDLVYSRQGQFKLAADGTVVTSQGLVLQQSGGGDLVLDNPAVKILADGTVLDKERPVGKIALFAPASTGSIQPLDGSLFHFTGGAAAEIADPQLHQGKVEASNVAVGDEMLTMMAALRQAESGSKLFQAYDELLGRAISSFGQGGQ